MRRRGDIGSHGSNGEETVFVVDPDHQAREELRAALAELGCAVRCYPSAEAFLRESGPGAAGCLVTELRLPGLSAVELLKRLQGPEWRLPAIILTEHGSVRAAVEAMGAGAAAFIEKPFAHRALRNEVRRFLA